MPLPSQSPKRKSDCCEAPAKVNVNDPGGSLFCSKCGADCKVSARKAPFRGYSTLSTVRKVTGEGQLFLKVWERCGGYSEVDKTQKLLSYGHTMWAAQFGHLLPKGSYDNERLELTNIVACTVKEHTEEWPLVKEKTDAELKAMGMSKWIPTVTVFRALRLKSNLRMAAQLRGE